jgi:hypothetical protein
MQRFNIQVQWLASNNAYAKVTLMVTIPVTTPVEDDTCGSGAAGLAGNSL